MFSILAGLGFRFMDLFLASININIFIESLCLVFSIYEWIRFKEININIFIFGISICI